MFKSILIVDDSLAARMMIKQYFEIMGCAEAAFQEAGNGKEALEKIKESDFDLIVTDMNMPVMDGYQFIKRLKASPKLSKLPIIIISSAAQKDNQERFMSYGANYIVSKPIAPQELHQAINSLAESND